MILQGDCRETLRTLPAESVQCCVTSPPYWGLRDYGHPGQLGLEPTPEEYVASMVEVFREVRRVLRPDGTLWLNLGDSFLPGKQLGGIPWRVAFALQADGWWLRSDIIWAKGNPMPESVTDRPTKAHEYVFLLSKSDRYYYDADAIAEDATGRDPGNIGHKYQTPGIYATSGEHQQSGLTAIGPRDKRNARTVWNINTRPFPDAHFAVFPPELPERCIRAGTSERGCCSECGAPWERVTERTAMVVAPSGRKEAMGEYGRTQTSGTMVQAPTSQTTGWRPTCEHDAPAVPCTVLDPFGGSGTTGYVAQELGRKWIACELNPEYIRIAERRTAQSTLWIGGAV